MAQANPSIKFTVEDYKNLPESETKRYELLKGDLVLTPPPNWRHQELALNLAARIKAFVDEHALGYVVAAPLDVLLGEDVVQPDILFISNERAHIIGNDVRGAPDLVVEIFSPATRERDRSYKCTLYARHGVREYWMVDPEAQTVEVLTLGERGFETASRFAKSQTLTSPLFPEFTLPLEQTFC